MTVDIRSILTSDKPSVRVKAIAMLPPVCSLTADALHQDVLRLVSYASHENLVTNKRTLEQEVEKFWIYKVESETLHMHKTLRHPPTTISLFRPAIQDQVSLLLTNLRAAWPYSWPYP
jgi:hypothetical protein